MAKRGTSAELTDEDQSGARARGIGKMELTFPTAQIAAGPTVQNLMRGAYPRSMSYGDLPERAGLYNDEDPPGIPGAATIGDDSPFDAGGDYDYYSGATGTGVYQGVDVGARGKPQVPRGKPQTPRGKPQTPRGKPQTTGRDGTPAEPRTAPTTDAGFAAYARLMTGGRRNLLPGWRRFRAFPNLQPAKEWVWYGRALYADRHRSSHPVLNPTRSQALTMARNASRLVPRAGRPGAPPMRGPVRKATVRGYIGSALGSNQIVNQGNDPAGQHYTLWHMTSGDMFRNDYYVIYADGGPDSDMTTWRNVWHTDADSTADLARANLQFSQFLLGGVDTSRPPPASIPGPSATPGTPGGSNGGGGGGGVLVNAIPGEEGRAVGAPLTPEEIAMDAAQPGSNIDPVTGRWIMGMTGPTAEYMASHPASVTPMDGGAPPGYDPNAPPGYDPNAPPQTYPDGQYPPGGGGGGGGGGGYGQPSGGPPGYGGPQGGVPVNVPPGTPQGQQYGAPPQQGPAYGQPFDPGMYAPPPFDPGMYDPGMYDPSAFDPSAYYGQPDEADEGAQMDTDDTTSGHDVVERARSVVGVMPGAELPEGMRRALQEGFYRELDRLLAAVEAAPHASQRAVNSIHRIDEVWRDRRDDVIPEDDIERFGNAIMDWKRRYLRRRA